MKTKKKSNRKAETVNIYLEIAKNVIEILAFAITIIKSLGNWFPNSLLHCTTYKEEQEMEILQKVKTILDVIVIVLGIALLVIWLVK